MMNREFWLIYKNLVSIFVFVGVVLGFAINTQGQTCTPAPVGLVSWYEGEAGALDSRSCNNGTLNGGTNFAAGKVGQAFSFDGIDDNIVVPNSPSLDITGNQLTIEAWINLNSSFSGFNQIVSMATNTSFPAGRKYGLFIDPGGQLGFEVNSTNGYIGSIPGGSVPTNTLVHVAGTYDGSTVTFYINGVPTSTQALTGNIVPSSGNFVIGQFAITGFSPFKGLIDEVGIYNRALSASEIQSIFNAGSAGKCKPTATVAPPRLVAWLAGDGNGGDLSGNNNNGILTNGATFTVGKVGQSFALDGIDDYVNISDSPALEVTTQLTIESWIKPSNTSQFRQIVSKFGTVGNYAYQIGLAPNGALRTDLSQTGGPAYEQLTSPENVITANVWNHVAVTFNAGAATLYVNGSSVASAILPINSIFGSGNTDVNIGRDPVGSQYFGGIIDETSIYNRALSGTEIQAIFNAGLAGKLKQAATPVGFSPESVVTSVGDTSITFQSVTAAGTTQEIPLDAALLPTLPTGATPTGLTYDIATSAVYSGNVDLCFNVPSLSGISAANLRVFHLENSIWVNRTASGATLSALCTTGVASLSPFALGFLTPSAANVSISGRVTTANGRGIVNAVMTLTDSDGVRKTAHTSGFGYYKFEDLTAGENYILSVTSKRFSFAEPTRIISAVDDVTDADFTANE